MVNVTVPELVIALDPSSRGLGVAGLYAGRLEVFELVSSSPKVTSFQEVRKTMVELTVALKKGIFDRSTQEFFSSIPELIFEIPPAKGQMAPLLWGLDCHLVNDLMSAGFKATGCSCLLCKSIMGGKKATKRDALNLVNSDPIFNDYLKLNDEWTKVESHNIAEALIILMTYSYIGCETQWGKDLFPSFAPYVVGKNFKYVRM